MNETRTPQEHAQIAHRAYQRGEFHSAASFFQSAASGFANANDPLTAAEMKNNASVSFLKAGMAGESLAIVENTWQVFVAEGDQSRQGMALGNYAAALEALGKRAEAEEAYRQSAELLHSAGEDDLYAYVMQAISQMELRKGQPLQAVATMQVGLLGIRKPTFAQRLARRLLRIPPRWLGWG